MNSKSTFGKINWSLFVIANVGNMNLKYIQNKFGKKKFNNLAIIKIFSKQLNI